ncbi:MAG: hypothetical protein AAF674_10005 [Pseudomonadota bacterium]
MTLGLELGSFSASAHASAVQVGRVTQVTSVSFTQPGEVRPTLTPSGVINDVDPGLYLPQDSQTLRKTLGQRIDAQIARNLQDIEQMLLGVYAKETRVELDDLDALRSPEVRATVSPTLADALTAFEAALRLSKAFTTDPGVSTPQFVSEQDAQDYVDQAIAAQVDARLRAELAAERASEEAKGSVLKLFEGVLDPETINAFEKSRRLSREAAILGQRDDMIADIKAAIDRGEISVAVSRASVWQGSDVSLSATDGSSTTLFVEDRLHLAYAAVSKTMLSEAGAILKRA